MMDFQVKIEETQKKAAQLRNDIAEMVAMAEAEERDLSDEESLQLESMAKDVEGCDKRVEDLTRAEQALAIKAVNKAAPAIIQSRPDKERAKGEIIFKQATAAFVGHVKNQNPLRVAEEAWPTDAGLHAVIKSAQEPAATDQAGWAQELTQEGYQGYLDLLRGESIAAQLWPVSGFNLTFDGYSAITIPERAGTGTDLASGWTGERDAIPVRSATFTSQKLYPYKWGAITTTSKELVMRSTPSIMSILQQGLIADTAQKLDADYFDSGAAVAGFRPAGTFNGVTGTAAATGGATTGDDMLTDIRNLIDPIYAANMGRTMRIVMHPSNALAMSTVLYNGDYLFRSELAGGSIFGIPVIQSTNAPTDQLWCFDMAELAVGSMAPTIDVNDSATLVMVDDDGVDPEMGAAYPRDPTGQVGDAARDTVNNPAIRSLYQTETVAIKLVQYLSWATLRTGAVNKITGVSY
jgi:HK97 family phage major capsid protein